MAQWGEPPASTWGPLLAPLSKVLGITLPKPPALGPIRESPAAQGMLYTPYFVRKLMFS